MRIGYYKSAAGRTESRCYRKSSPSKTISINKLRNVSADIFCRRRLQNADNVFAFWRCPHGLRKTRNGFAIGAAVLIVILALVAGFSMGWGPFDMGGGLRASSSCWNSISTIKNPILKIGAVEKLAPGVRDLVSTLSIAVVCIIAALAVFGIISMIVGPHGDPEDEDEEDSDLDEGEKGARRFEAQGRKTYFCRQSRSFRARHDCQCCGAGARHGKPLRWSSFR